LGKLNKILDKKWRTECHKLIGKLGEHLNLSAVSDSNDTLEDFTYDMELMRHIQSPSLGGLNSSISHCCRY
jgi:hypothetical protein